MKRLPEIHVYRGERSTIVRRVMWRGADGREFDLTPLSVVGIDRHVAVDAIPVTKVEFFATLVEHQEAAA